MDHTHPDPAPAFLRACASVTFGRIAPGGGELAFYGELNEAMIRFIRSLPASMQSEAMLFCTRYAGLRIGDPLDFFRNYHAPVWSVIYWTAAGRVGSEHLRDTADAHAMAMLLHSLDDHLADGELPATHLSLLIRSQAWLVMREALARLREALARLGEAAPGGADAVRDLLDEYYAGISDPARPDTLEEYCVQFRRQMATGLIVPHLATLLAGRGQGEAALVRSASESFGVAWRLLDDIQDLGDDLRRGRRTAVFCCLPPEGRALWEAGCSDPGAGCSDTSGSYSDTGTCFRNDSFQILVNIMQKERVIPTIISLMVEELDSAAGFAAKAGLEGLANEFRCLAGPLILNKWVPE